jgi:hypothetical protein
MTLREMKRSGGFLLPDSRGAWERFGPAQMAKCPKPVCRRSFMQASHVSEVWVRLAVQDAPLAEPSGFVLCPDRRCKARLEVRILPAGSEG